MVLAACLLISGCLGGAPGSLREASSPQAGAAAHRGGHDAFAVQRGRLVSVTGCVLSYSRYSAASAQPGDLVVLGHGFLRGQANMAGLARALAASGVTTLTLDFCKGSPFAGNHFRNGLDMMALARAQGARRVVYVGFSAGALAALVAGRNDPRSLGIVALDLVDAEGLGALMAAGLEVPLVGLVGDASSCNAYNNGLSLYAASRQALVRRFPGADHCDFESETDWLCRLVCPPGAADAALMRQAIIKATVDAVAELFATADAERRSRRPARLSSRAG
ncbi:alpha/beta hydrolase [Thiorhodococcus mannitoliphagus]|uniref:alpha/beta hydrolase n=1 Tax=Thiorhodococcus mannitoliphagus TaxID=329406 RepID=UPI001981C23E